MNEPTTKAGRALLAREAYNSRSFDLITADAILAIEAEASALAAEPDAPFPFVGADGIPYYPDYDTPSLHRREQVAALASREPDDGLDVIEAARRVALWPWKLVDAPAGAVLASAGDLALLRERLAALDALAVETPR